MIFPLKVDMFSPNYDARHTWVKGLIGMDDLDLRILKRLQINSNDSRKVMANDLGISEPTLSKRISSLTEENFINRFTIDINFSKVGYTLSAITFIKEKNQAATEELGILLSSYVEASHVYRVTGDWDYAIIWLCKNSEELDDCLSRLYKNNINIEELKTEVFLKSIKRQSTLR